MDTDGGPVFIFISGQIHTEMPAVDIYLPYSGCLEDSSDS